MKQITVDAAGRTVQAFVGEAELLELRDARAGSSSRTVKWRLDGQPVFAFFNAEKNPELLAAVTAVGVGGTADVVLSRSRKLRRKDGSPVPQMGSWDELDVFEDTFTAVSSVNGVLAVDTPRPVIEAGPAPVAGRDAPVGVAVSQARDPEVSLARFAAAVECGVPRPVLHQMAAIMLLDGCDPLSVHRALMARALPGPSDRKKPKRTAPEPVAHESGASESAAGSTQPMNATPVSQEPSGDVASPAVAAAPVTGPIGLGRVRRDNTPPPPRRMVAPRISLDQIQVLQKIAVRAGVGADQLDAWALTEFGCALASVTWAQADALITEVRELGPVDGVARFTRALMAEV